MYPIEIFSIILQGDYFSWLNMRQTSIRFNLMLQSKDEFIYNLLLFYQINRPITLQSMRDTNIIIYPDYDALHICFPSTNNKAIRHDVCIYKSKLTYIDSVREINYIPELVQLVQDQTNGNLQLSNFALALNNYDVVRAIMFIGDFNNKIVSSTFYKNCQTNISLDNFPFELSVICIDEYVLGAGYKLKLLGYHVTCDYVSKSITINARDSGIGILWDCDELF